VRDPGLLAGVGKWRFAESDSVLASVGETVTIGSEWRDSESDYWPVSVLARLRVRVRRADSGSDGVAGPAL